MRSTRRAIKLRKVDRKLKRRNHVKDNVKRNSETKGKMALKHRHVDDSLKSIVNKTEANLPTTQVMEVPGRIGMKIKGPLVKKLHRRTFLRTESQ